MTNDNIPKLDHRHVSKFFGACVKSGLSAHETCRLTLMMMVQVAAINRMTEDEMIEMFNRVLEESRH